MVSKSLIGATKISNKNNLTNKARMKLYYVNDKTNRLVNKLIAKYNLPIQLVNKANQTLQTTLKNSNTPINRHDNCNICTVLPCKYSCSDRFIVYKFTCNYCKEFYVGQTSRSFFVDTLSTNGLWRMGMLLARYLII